MVDTIDMSRQATFPANVQLTPRANRLVNCDLVRRLLSGARIGCDRKRDVQPAILNDIILFIPIELSAEKPVQSLVMRETRMN